MSRPRSSWPMGSRWSGWIPRRRSWSGASPTAARSGKPSGEPERVKVHDFPDPKLGKAIPDGVYALGGNGGWVGVGVDHDSAAFAVQTLRRWWEQVGRAAYPRAERLLVTADAGGSNGYRVRAWKTELARLAAETGLQITVCHLVGRPAAGGPDARPPDPPGGHRVPDPAGPRHDPGPADRGSHGARGAHRGGRGGAGRRWRGGAVPGDAAWGGATS